MGIKSRKSALALTLTLIPFFFSFFLLSHDNVDVSNTIGAMEVFTHHIQEYSKGLRALVLYTTKASNRDAIEKRLKRRMIDYYIQKVNGTKINVFFGNSICVAVIKQMNITSLSNLTDEEDFILGTMPVSYTHLRAHET